MKVTPNQGAAAIRRSVACARPAIIKFFMFLDATRAAETEEEDFNALPIAKEFCKQNPDLAALAILAISEIEWIITMGKDLRSPK